MILNVLAAPPLKLFRQLEEYLQYDLGPVILTREPGDGDSWGIALVVHGERTDPIMFEAPQGSNAEVLTFLLRKALELLQDLERVIFNAKDLLYEQIYDLDQLVKREGL